MATTASKNQERRDPLHEEKACPVHLLDMHTPPLSTVLGLSPRINVTRSPCLIRERAVVLSWEAGWLLLFAFSISSWEDPSFPFFFYLQSAMASIDYRDLGTRPSLTHLYPYYKSAQITQHKLDVGCYSLEARNHLLNRPRSDTQSEKFSSRWLENPDSIVILLYKNWNHIVIVV
jgi:hypothetical protein